VLALLSFVSPALAVRGSDAQGAPVETPRCVQRLRSLTDSQEKIEIQTENDRVTGRLRTVRDGLLLIAPREAEPETELAIPLDAITGVAYWRHDELQPDWIVAGLACGVMAGALIGAMTGEDTYCDGFACDTPWLRSWCRRSTSFLAWKRNDWQDDLTAASTFLSAISGEFLPSFCEPRRATASLSEGNWR
jgi:hypothetical protein